MMNSEKYSGFSLVEALLAIAIFSSAIAVIINSLIYVQDSNIAATNLNKASLLAQEGIEVAKGIRNENFALLVDGMYRLNVNSGKYELINGAEAIGSFSRQIIIDSNDLDSYSKRVTSQVSWSNRVGPMKTVENQIILSDWERTIILGNWTNPTVASVVDASGNQDVVDLMFEDEMLFVLRSNGEFLVYGWNSGASSIDLLGSTSVANGAYRFDKSGFYIAIASSANNQELAIVSIQDAPTVISTENMPGNQDALETIITDSRLYVLRDYSGDPPNKPRPNDVQTLYIYTHNDNAIFNPSSSLLLSSRTVSRLAEYNNYVYIGSNHSDEEVVIVNATSASNPAVAGSIDLPGNNAVTAMAVDGEYLYIAGNDSKLYIYHLIGPQAPVFVSSVDTPANVYAIDIGDQKIFGISRSVDNEFFVIDINNVANPYLKSVLAVPDTLYDVVYDPAIDRAFIGGADNSSEIRIISQ